MAIDQKLKNPQFGFKEILRSSNLFVAKMGPNGRWL